MVLVRLQEDKKCKRNLGHVVDTIKKFLDWLVVRWDANKTDVSSSHLVSISPTFYEQRFRTKEFQLFSTYSLCLYVFGKRTLAKSCS